MVNKLIILLLTSFVIGNLKSLNIDDDFEVRDYVLFKNKSCNIILPSSFEERSEDIDMNSYYADFLMFQFLKKKFRQISNESNKHEIEGLKELRLKVIELEIKKLLELITMKCRQSEDEAKKKKYESLAEKISTFLGQ